MGYIVRRCVYTGNGPDAKKKLIASIARFVGILKTTARVSLGVEFGGPITVDVIKQNGSTMHREVDDFTDIVFSELLEARSFKVEFKVLPTSKPLRKPYTTKVLFWYDQEHNLNNSVNLELATGYPENLLSFSFFGLIAKMNLVKMTGFRIISESFNDRIKSLWESVMRMAFGTYGKTERTFQLRKYEPESLLLNIFGKFVEIKE